MNETSHDSERIKKLLECLPKRVTKAFRVRHCNQKVSITIQPRFARMGLIVNLLVSLLAMSGCLLIIIVGDMHWVGEAIIGFILVGAILNLIYSATNLVRKAHLHPEKLACIDLEKGVLELEIIKWWGIVKYSMLVDIKDVKCIVYIYEPGDGGLSGHSVNIVTKDNKLLELSWMGSVAEALNYALLIGKIANLPVFRLTLYADTGVIEEFNIMLCRRISDSTLAKARKHTKWI